MTAHVALYGRLGEEPKEIATSSGAPMAAASLAVAIEEHGVEDPPPLWVGVLAFGRLAEELLRHHKGDLLSVAGRLRRKRWTDREGREREQLELLADALVSARTVRPAGGRRYRPAGLERRAPAPRPRVEPELDDAIPF